MESNFSAHELAVAIEKALKSLSAVNEPIVRGSCCIDNCPNDSYAKGMCRAHYARQKRNKNLDKPLKIKMSPSCLECGKKSYGNSLCLNHYRKLKKEAIKKALVDAMGGVCESCGESFPLCVFDFHHVSDKDIRPAKVIAQGNIKAIASEISKCVLLCANCHRIEHHGR